MSTGSQPGLSGAWMVTGPPLPPGCYPACSLAAPAGPVFLADIDPTTGRGLLSYPRAEYLFKTASAQLDLHRQGWTLHQLRHSALQHLARARRTASELQAKSRHQHLVTRPERRVASTGCR
jgi:integrase